jgi:hypothetical protein
MKKQARKTEKKVWSSLNSNVNRLDMMAEQSNDCLAIWSSTRGLTGNMTDLAWPFI